MAKESLISKKENKRDDGVAIGDKTDLRICTKSGDGRVVDLACVEFAKNNNDNKFYSDHRKILREGKTVVDQFYRFSDLKSREKRSIAGCCIQIAGVEGQVMNVRLVDQGLYVASRLGSLRLPSSHTELRKMRTLLERLFSLKANLVYIKNCLRNLEFDKSSEKCMDKTLNTKRSPYENFPNESGSSDEEISDQEDSEKETSEVIKGKPTEEDTGINMDTKYISWIRGSWFPPPPKKDQTYDGIWHKYLFSLPPPSP